VAVRLVMAPLVVSTKLVYAGPG